MLSYRIMADLVLLVHAAFVLFVIIGLLLIVLGMIFRWRWVRNFWFRMLHLLAIGVVVLQAWFGLACPLTTLENYLRFQAGESTYPGGFVAFWVHQMLFYEAELWVFTLSYTAFGLLVVATFLFAPPRFPWRRSRTSQER